MKNNTLTFLFSLTFLIFISSCSPTKKATSSEISTKATTYQIFQNGKFVNAKLDQKPEAVEGERKFLMTMYRKLKYPSDGRDKGIQGTVKVQVIVSKKGHLVSSIVKKSLRKDFDKEALEAVRRGFELQFNPAMLNGEAVRVRYEIPVKFSLNG